MGENRGEETVVSSSKHSEKITCVISISCAWAWSWPWQVTQETWIFQTQQTPPYRALCRLCPCRVHTLTVSQFFIWGTCPGHLHHPVRRCLCQIHIWEHWDTFLSCWCGDKFFSKYVGSTFRLRAAPLEIVHSPICEAPEFWGVSFSMFTTWASVLSSIIFPQNLREVFGCFYS